MNTKSTLFIGAIIAICIIAGLVFFSIPSKEPPNPDQDYLDALQGNPPDNYIDQLKTLITTHPDPYVREKGIITLTEIAISKNESEKISGFLKDLALNATDESVRMEADASYGLIRSEKPLPQKAVMKISIEDNIRKGATISLLVDFHSSVENNNVHIGISSLNNSIALSSPQIVGVQVKANQPQRVKFSLNLKEEGRYIIPVVYTMSFDRLDYEKIQKRVFLIVNQTGGSYFII